MSQTEHVFKMLRCLLCDKKFKTERGLSVHLTRTHNIRGPRGRLSLDTIQRFFPLLEKKRWAKAERKLKKTAENLDNDEWVNGYLHALSGMITALKSSYSIPPPYVINLKEQNDKKLQKAKKKFSDFSNKLNTKNEFDAAYFQAWEDYTQYTLHKKNENKTNSTTQQSS